MSRYAVSCEHLASAAYLEPFQNVVIGIALLPDLRRHAVEPLWAVLGTRESHVCDRARNSAIAIVERVYCHQPKVCNPRFKDRINRLLAFEPVQK